MVHSQSLCCAVAKSQHLAYGTNEAIVARFSMAYPRHSLWPKWGIAEAVFQDVQRVPLERQRNLSLSTYWCSIGFANGEVNFTHDTMVNKDSDSLRLRLRQCLFSINTINIHKRRRGNNKLVIYVYGVHAIWIINIAEYLCMGLPLRFQVNRCPGSPYEKESNEKPGEFTSYEVKCAWVQFWYTHWYKTNEFT